MTHYPNMTENNDIRDTATIKKLIEIRSRIKTRAWDDLQYDDFLFLVHNETPEEYDCRIEAQIRANPERYPITKAPIF